VVSSVRLFRHCELHRLLVVVVWLKMTDTAVASAPVVTSFEAFDGWNTLEEIVIGSPYHSRLPFLEDDVIVAKQIEIKKTSNPLIDPMNPFPFEWMNTAWSKGPVYNNHSQTPIEGCYYPKNMEIAAAAETDNLARILELQYGVKVHRPKPENIPTEYTVEANDNDPGFTCRSSFNANNPRDCFVVVGNTCYETPMARRPRKYEYQAYSHLWDRAGDHFEVMPKNEMRDALYDPSTEFISTEAEICMDGADCLKAGKHLFIQRSTVTNRTAINWMSEHLRKTQGIIVHDVAVVEDYPEHIDATLTILRPGLLLGNPARPLTNPTIEAFKKVGWDHVVAPKSRNLDNLMCSNWLNVNMLSIADDRVVIEENEKETIQQLESLGIKCVPVPYRNNYRFGGGLHCSTLDIRRKGSQPLDYGLDGLENALKQVAEKA